MKKAEPFSLFVPYAAHLHTCHHVSHVFELMMSGECLILTSFYIMYCFASLIVYFLASFMYVVVSAHACLHVRVCLCVHAHLLTSRGGGPSSPQTNPPLSLKAVMWLQAGCRQQTGPAGKQESDLAGVLHSQELHPCSVHFPLPLINLSRFSES